MRHHVAALLLLLATFAAIPAGAAERFSLFAGLQPGASYSEARGFDAETGVALGLALPRGRWSAELQAAWNRFGVVVTDAKSRTRLVDGDERAADLALFYRFAETGRWTLRAGAGVRWAERDEPLTATSAERWATLVAFGADCRLSERVALALDARHPLTTVSGVGEFSGASDLSLGLRVGF